VIDDAFSNVSGHDDGFTLEGASVYNSIVDAVAVFVIRSLGSLFGNLDAVQIVTIHIDSKCIARCHGYSAALSDDQAVVTYVAANKRYETAFSSRNGALVYNLSVSLANNLSSFKFQLR